MKTTICATENFEHEVSILPIAAVKGAYYLEISSRLFSAKDPRAKRVNFSATLSIEDLRALRALTTAAIDSFEKS